jgi:hypothetical protein
VMVAHSSQGSHIHASKHKNQTITPNLKCEKMTQRGGIWVEGRAGILLALALVVNYFAIVLNATDACCHHRTGSLTECRDCCAELEKDFAYEQDLAGRPTCICTDDFKHLQGNADSSPAETCSTFKHSFSQCWDCCSYYKLLNELTPKPYFSFGVSCDCPGRGL